MNILNIPFHQYLKLRNHPTDEYIFEMDENPECQNHIGTIHACVQLALAEASAGAFLQQQFPASESNIVPVVRSTEVKYHRPAQGTLYARCAFGNSGVDDALQELNTKNRTLLKVKSEVFDAGKNKVLTAWFEWFLARRNSETK